MMLSIPSSSKEYIRVPVTGSYTPSTPVHVAIVPHGQEPADADWQVAAWDDGRARVLIGPSTDLALTEGIYGIWVKVTTDDEVPVLPSGPLKIT